MKDEKLTIDVHMWECRTTPNVTSRAEKRPNVYLGGPHGLPQPFPVHLPFRPSTGGSVLRHFRKPSSASTGLRRSLVATKSWDIFSARQITWCIMVAVSHLGFYHTTGEQQNTIPWFHCGRRQLWDGSAGGLLVLLITNSFLLLDNNQSKQQQGPWQ